MNHEHLELLVAREMPYGKYKGRLIADLKKSLLHLAFAGGVVTLAMDHHIEDALNMVQK